VKRAEQLEEIAAYWLMRREDADWTDADEAAFQEWLQQAIVHKAVYWRLEYGWRQADRLSALGLAEEGQSLARHRRSYWAPAALAASIVLLAIIGFGGMILHSGPNAEVKIAAKAPEKAEKAASKAPGAIAWYSTPIGKRKTAILSDGSRIELNTDTVMRTSISDAGREAWLDKGEAFFKISHIPGLRFIVHAGKQTVTVLGTQFVVRRKENDDLAVSVVEGRVQIGNARSDPLSTSSIITAGDIAISSGSSTLFVHGAGERIHDALGWREGKLNFDRSTLAEAVAEFNRYNERQIVIDDPQIAILKIGGSFQASNIGAFLRLLHDAYGLKVSEMGDQVKISRP